MEKVNIHRLYKQGVMSLRGVYNDIKNSHYILTDGELLFFFTSEYNMNKFSEMYEENREDYKKRLDKAFKDGQVYPVLMFDVTLYKSIENRGFYIMYNNIELSENDLRNLSLDRLIENKTYHYDFLETLTYKQLSGGN